MLDVDVRGAGGALPLGGKEILLHVMEGSMASPHSKHSVSIGSGSRR